MKKLTTVALLTVGLGTALFACPSGGDGQRGGGYKNGMQKIMKQLDLSSEQKDQLKTLRESRKAMMQTKRKEFKENRKSMRAQMKPDMSTFMTANTFDKEAFKQEMQKKHEARRAMRDSKKSSMLESRADNMEKMFNILTPEQRIKWIELSKTQEPNQGKNCKR
jgi:periplasmic protein CpxP/Spy